MPASRTTSSNRRNRVAHSQRPTKSQSRSPRGVGASGLDPAAATSTSANHDDTLAPPTPATLAALGILAASPAPTGKRKPRKRSPKWKEQGRPPRPPNAFIIFKSTLKNNPQFREEYLNRLGVGENIGCLAASVWNSLSPAEKKPWYDQAERIAVEHAEKYPNYKYQPQKKKKTSSKKRKRSPTPEDDEDDEVFDYEDDNEETGIDEDEDETASPVTVNSPSRSDENHERKQRRFVDVYTGREDNLDALYACGWKWALIKEIDESALENPLGDSQESDPVFHITPQDGDDETANLLPLPLDIMASVLNEAHSGLDTTAMAQIEDTMDPSLQLFGHWDPQAAPSSAYFYDAPPSQGHSHGLHPYAESS